MHARLDSEHLRVHFHRSAKLNLHCIQVTPAVFLGCDLSPCLSADIGIVVGLHTGIKVPGQTVRHHYQAVFQVIPGIRWNWGLQGNT